MTSKTKVLGLLLVAMLAMNVAVARATSSDFQSGTTNLATLTAGGADHAFEVTGQTASCETVSFTGEEAPEDPFDGTFEAIAVTPEYTDCEAFGFVGAKVTGFGHYGEEATCEYLWRADGTMDLECDEGAEVTIDAATCFVHVPEQTGLKGLDYSNKGGHVEIDFEVEEITVAHTDGFLCPFSGSGEGAIGSLTGTSTVEGEDAEGGPVTVSHDATG